MAESIQRCVASPFGQMLVEVCGEALTQLRPLGVGEPAPEAALAQAPDARFDRVEAWLAAYARGEQPAPPLPLAPAGTAFQQRVWHALQAIPYGETCTYGALASALGCKSARAVGQAIARNPILLLIPCHRVVGAHGLGGFSAGEHLKRRVLELEARGRGKD